MHVSLQFSKIIILAKIESDSSKIELKLVKLYHGYNMGYV